MKESVSSMEEFLNKRIDQTSKDSQFITTNHFDLFKRNIDAKHTQIKEEKKKEMIVKCKSDLITYQKF